MPPGVAEIVLVDKGGALFRRDAGQADAPVICVEIVVLWTRLAVVDAVGCVRYNKLMEMGVRPAHRDLHHLVQFMQGEIRRHNNAPPDRRLDLSQADIQRVLEVSASRWHSLLLSSSGRNPSTGLSLLALQFNHSTSFWLCLSITRAYIRVSVDKEIMSAWEQFLKRDQ